MTQRFAATGLDLSRLPPPAVIKGLDYAAILAARLARVRELLAAAGVPYDVEALASDPFVALEREDAYRELLDLASINDAAKAVMLAFAVGSDLDGLAAFYGVRRRTIIAATPDTPAILESDDELRARVQVAPEALTTTGTAGAYVHHAEQASSEIVDVAVLSPAPGQVRVVLLSRFGDGTPSDAALAAVRAELFDDAVKPLTVDLGVLVAVPVDYAIEIRLWIARGPDPDLVGAAARAAILNLAGVRRRIGEDINVSAIIAAAHVSGVEKVDVLRPVADIIIGPAEVGRCTGVTVSSVLLP